MGKRAERTMIAGLGLSGRLFTKPPGKALCSRAGFRGQFTRRRTDIARDINTIRFGGRHCARQDSLQENGEQCQRSGQMIETALHLLPAIKRLSSSETEGQLSHDRPSGTAKAADALDAEGEGEG